VDGTQFTCFTGAKVQMLTWGAACQVFSTSMLTYAVVCWRMPTYADVCWADEYADVCWLMLTYADVCWQVFSTRSVRLSLMADPMTEIWLRCLSADVCWRMMTYADNDDLCCRMLTYSEVCWQWRKSDKGVGLPIVNTAVRLKKLVYGALSC
jgi:hypothetical protein